MGLEIPSEVRWLFKIIVGDEWPLGDEEELRDLGAVWDQAAEELNGLAPALSDATGAVLTAIEGMAADEYRKFMKDLGAKLPAMVNASRELGNLARQTALEVEYSKYMVIGSLILLAQSIAAALSASFFTFGASAAAIPAMQTAARFTVKAILRKLFQAILQGVIRQVALDAAVQGIQVLKGDRTSWDWEKTKGAAIAGAVGGVIGFGLGAGISKFAPQLEGKVLTEVVKGGSHELLTSLAVDKVNRSSETDWSAFTAGATEGVFDGIKGRAGGGNSNATSNISDMSVTDIGDIPGAGGVPTVPTMGSGDSTRGSDTTLDTSDVPQVYVPGGSVPQTQVGATAASDVPGTAVAGTANPVTGVSRPVDTTDTVARTETATVTHATTPVVTVSHGTPTAQDPLGINTPVQPSNNTNPAAVGVAETHHTSASVATPTTVNTSVAVAPASEATSAPATVGTTPHATAPATVTSTPVATPTASATTISSPAQTVAATPTSTTVSPVGPTSVSTVTSPQSPVSAVASSPTAASAMTPAAAGTPTISTPASATPMAGTASPTNAPSTAVPASGTSATAGSNLTPAVVNSTASPAKGSAGNAKSSDSAPVPPAVSAVTTDPEAVSRGLAALDAAAREQAERQARTLVDEAADRQTIAAVAYAVAQAGPAVAAALANTLGNRRTSTTGTSAEPTGVRLVNPEDASSAAPQSMMSEPSSDGSASPTAPIVTGLGANDETTPNSSPAFTSGTEVQTSREQSQIQDASQQDHAVLVEALPKDAEGAPSRFPDPFASDWAKRVNDGGITVPGRSNNCADLGLSVLSTWFGKPTVAGSRTNGIGGEPGSTTRQQELLGTDFQRLPGADPTTKYDLLQQQLIAAGPGAAALIITTGKQPTAPSSHTWNAVNHDGTIVWIDAQAGRVSTEGPLYVDGVTDVWAIPLDADSRPLQPATDSQGSGHTPTADPETAEQTTAETPDDALPSASSGIKEDSDFFTGDKDWQDLGKPEERYVEWNSRPADYVTELHKGHGLLVRTIQDGFLYREFTSSAVRGPVQSAEKNSLTGHGGATSWSYIHAENSSKLFTLGGRQMGIIADPIKFLGGGDARKKNEKSKPAVPDDEVSRIFGISTIDKASNNKSEEPPKRYTEESLGEEFSKLREELAAAKNRGSEGNCEIETYGMPVNAFLGVLFVSNKPETEWHGQAKKAFQENVDALAPRSEVDLRSHFGKGKAEYRGEPFEFAENGIKKRNRFDAQGMDYLSFPAAASIDVYTVTEDGKGFRFLETLALSNNNDSGDRRNSENAALRQSVIASTTESASPAQRPEPGSVNPVQRGASAGAASPAIPAPPTATKTPPVWTGQRRDVGTTSSSSGPAVPAASRANVREVSPAASDSVQSPGEPVQGSMSVKDLIKNFSPAKKGNPSADLSSEPNPAASYSGGGKPRDTAAAAAPRTEHETGNGKEKQTIADPLAELGPARIAANLTARAVEHGQQRVSGPVDTSAAAMSDTRQPADGSVGTSPEQVVAQPPAPARSTTGNTVPITERSTSFAAARAAFAGKSSSNSGSGTSKGKPGTSGTQQATAPPPVTGSTFDSGTQTLSTGSDKLVGAVETLSGSRTDSGLQRNGDVPLDARFAWLDLVQGRVEPGGDPAAFEANCWLAAIAVDMSLDEGFVYQAGSAEAAPEAYLGNYVGPNNQWKSISSGDLAGVLSPGQRGFLQVRGNNAVVGHVLNVVRDGSGPVFLDATRGRAYRPEEIAAFLDQGDQVSVLVSGDRFAATVELSTGDDVAPATSNPAGWAKQASQADRTGTETDLLGAGKRRQGPAGAKNSRGAARENRVAEFQAQPSTDLRGNPDLVFTTIQKLGGRGNPPPPKAAPALDHNDWSLKAITDAKSVDVPASWGSSALHHKVSKSTLEAVGERLVNDYNKVAEARQFWTLVNALAGQDVRSAADGRAVKLLWNLPLNLSQGPPNPVGDPGMGFDPDTVPAEEVGPYARRLDSVSESLKAFDEAWAKFPNELTDAAVRSEAWLNLSTRLAEAASAFGQQSRLLAEPAKEQWLPDPVPDTENVQHIRKGLRRFPGVEKGASLFTEERNSARAETIATEPVVVNATRMVTVPDPSKKGGSKSMEVTLQLSLDEGQLNHIAERHTMARFNFDDAKAVNTFWPPGTGMDELRTIAGDVLPVLGENLLRQYLPESWTEAGDLTWIPENIDSPRLTAGDHEVFVIGSSIEIADESDFDYDSFPDSLILQATVKTIAPEGASAYAFLRSELAAIKETVVPSAPSVSPPAQASAELNTGTDEAATAPQQVRTYDVTGSWKSFAAKDTKDLITAPKVINEAVDAGVLRDGSIVEIAYRGESWAFKVSVSDTGRVQVGFQKDRLVGATSLFDRVPGPAEAPIISPDVSPGPTGNALPVTEISTSFVAASVASDRDSSGGSAPVRLPMSTAGFVAYPIGADEGNRDLDGLAGQPPPSSGMAFEVTARDIDDVKDWLKTSQVLVALGDSGNIKEVLMGRPKKGWSDTEGDHATAWVVMKEVIRSASIGRSPDEAVTALRAIGDYIAPSDEFLKEVDELAEIGEQRLAISRADYESKIEAKGQPASEMLTTGLTLRSQAIAVPDPIINANALQNGPYVQSLQAWYWESYKSERRNRAVDVWRKTSRVRLAPDPVLNFRCTVATLLELITMRPFGTILPGSGVGAQGKGESAPHRVLVAAELQARVGEGVVSVSDGVPDEFRAMWKLFDMAAALRAGGLTASETTIEKIDPQVLAEVLADGAARRPDVLRDLGSTGRLISGKGVSIVKSLLDGHWALVSQAFPAVARKYDMSNERTRDCMKFLVTSSIAAELASPFSRAQIHYLAITNIDMLLRSGQQFRSAGKKGFDVARDLVKSLLDNAPRVDTTPLTEPELLRETLADMKSHPALTAISQILVGVLVKNREVVENAEAAGRDIASSMARDFPNNADAKWGDGASSISLLVGVDLVSGELGDVRVGSVHIKGRPSNPVGIGGMGSHSTAFVVETEVIRKLVQGKSVQEAAAALWNHRSDPALSLVAHLPPDQLDGGLLINLLDARIAVSYTCNAVTTDPRSEKLAEAISAFLTYRNMLPYATTDEGDRGGHGESSAPSDYLQNFDHESLWQAAEGYRQATLTRPEDVLHALSVAHARLSELKDAYAERLNSIGDDRNFVEKILLHIAMQTERIKFSVLQPAETRLQIVSEFANDICAIRRESYDKAMAIAFTDRSMIDVPSWTAGFIGERTVTGPGDPISPEGSEPGEPAPSPATQQAVVGQATTGYDSGDLSQPSPTDQAALENAMPRDDSGAALAHQDPRQGNWSKLVNDGGPGVFGRANNCADTALSFVATWFGNPVVSGSRTAELSAEPGSTRRQEQALGGTFRRSPGVTVPEMFSALAGELRAAGHGAAAVIITTGNQPAAATAHSWNAVNYQGDIVWVDAQNRIVATDAPIHTDGVAELWGIVLDPDGRPASATPVQDRTATAPAESTAPLAAGPPPPVELPMGASERISQAREILGQRRTESTAPLAAGPPPPAELPMGASESAVYTPNPPSNGAPDLDAAAYAPAQQLLTRLATTTGPGGDGIAVVINDGDNFGHQAAGVMLVDSLRRLGYSGTLKVVTSKDVQEKLKVILGDRLAGLEFIIREERDENSQNEDPGGQEDAYRPALAIVAAMDGIADGMEESQEILQGLNSDAALVLQPYAWQFGNRLLIFRDAVRETTEVRNLGGGVISEYSLYQFEYSRITEAAHAEYVITRNLTDSRVAGLLAIAGVALDPNPGNGRAPVEVMPVYGVHRLDMHRRHGAVGSLVAAMRGAYPQHRSIVLDIGDTRIDFDPEYSQDWLHVAHVADDGIAAIVDSLGAGQVLLLRVGKVPQPVFQLLYQLGTAPAVLEGANTSNFAQLVGRPYFTTIAAPESTLGRTETKFPIPDKTLIRSESDPDGLTQKSLDDAIKTLNRVTEALTAETKWSRKVAKLSDYGHLNKIDLARSCYDGLHGIIGESKDGSGEMAQDHIEFLRPIFASLSGEDGNPDDLFHDFLGNIFGFSERIEKAVTVTPLTYEKIDAEPIPVTLEQVETVRLRLDRRRAELVAAINEEMNRDDSSEGRGSRDRESVWSEETDSGASENLGDTIPHDDEVASIVQAIRDLMPGARSDLRAYANAVATTAWLPQRDSLLQGLNQVIAANIFGPLDENDTDGLTHSRGEAPDPQHEGHAS